MQKIDPLLSEQAERNVNIITNVMIKNSILFGMAIIFNQCFYGSLLYMYLSDQYSSVTFRYSLPYSLRAIETISNIYILWLNLRINYRHYIHICKWCHLCASKCFQHQDIQTSLENPYIELTYAK